MPTVPTTHCPLPTAHYPPPTARFSLLIYSRTHYSPQRSARNPICPSTRLPMHPCLIDGYTSFAVPLTGLKTGTNLLAIRVESFGSNSRWYAGAGLFRPVSLLGHPAVHVATAGGVYVTTPRVDLLTPDGTAASATVAVNISVHNDQSVKADVSAKVQLFEDDTGKLIATKQLVVGNVPAGDNRSAIINFELSHVWTWGPSSPKLYRAAVTLQPGSDVEVVMFGVRSFSFNATHGLVLNGQRVKMYGGCVHHDK